MNHFGSYTTKAAAADLFPAVTATTNMRTQCHIIRKRKQTIIARLHTDALHGATVAATGSGHRWVLAANSVKTRRAVADVTPHNSRKTPFKQHTTRSGKVLACFAHNNDCCDRGGTL